MQGSQSSACAWDFNISYIICWGKILPKHLGRCSEETGWNPADRFNQHKSISKKYLVSILYIDEYMQHLKDGTDKPISKSGIEMQT